MKGPLGVPLRPLTARTDEALTQWLFNDLTRAHWLLARHFRTDDGFCWHQGADPRRERHSHPCRIHNAARAAVLAHSIPTQRKETACLRNRITTNAR